MSHRSIFTELALEPYFSPHWYSCMTTAVLQESFPMEGKKYVAPIPLPPYPPPPKAEGRGNLHGQEPSIVAGPFWSALSSQCMMGSILAHHGMSTAVWTHRQD